LTFRGHVLTSSVTSPFDTAYAISYRCPIVTESISTSFRNNGLLKYWGYNLDLSRSRDVIDDDIIRSTLGRFLLVGNWYQASISNHFRDICMINITRSRFWHFSVTSGHRSRDHWI